jgi:glycosyltransferase involved in cell wall biosynthesis
MKVLIFNAYYTEGCAYLENQLPKTLVILGHQVKVVCSTLAYINGKQEIIKKESYINRDGFSVVRLPVLFNSKEIFLRVRKVNGLYDELSIFQPDLVILQDISGLEGVTIIRYKKRNPYIRVFCFNHAALYNSAQNLVSKNLLHRMILAPIARSVCRKSEKVFYIGTAEKKFLDFYRINEEKSKLFPLGDFIISDDEYYSHRDTQRKRLGIIDSDFVIVHSGRLSEKKRTFEIIEAFLNTNLKNAKLIIVGVMDESVLKETRQIIDKNKDCIIYLGWTDSTILKQILCASDVYVQFSVSSTFQTALCTRCYGITTNPKDTYNYLPPNICSFIQTKDELITELSRIGLDKELLEYSRRKSYEFAKRHLDYIKLAKQEIIEVYKKTK